MSVLAVGALSLERYRSKVSRFLVDEGRHGHVRSIEVSVFSLDDVRAGSNEWSPKESEWLPRDNGDLGGIAERIASHIVEHEGAGATILVRHDV